MEVQAARNRMGDITQRMDEEVARSQATLENHQSVRQRAKLAMEASIQEAQEEIQVV